MKGQFRFGYFTPQYDATVAFYRDGLELPILESWDRHPDDRGTLFAASSGMIEVLLQPQGQSNHVWDSRPPQGTFMVIEVEQVEALYRRASAKNLPIQQVLTEQDWGHRSFCVKEPNGLTLYFFEPLREPESKSAPPPPTLESWEYRDTEAFLQAAQLHAHGVDELVSPCATRHDAGFELHACVVDLHRMMRQNYLRTIHDVGRNIYPLIIARDNEPDMDRSDWGRQGVGGTYTLYLEGETHSVRPTPRAYELLKCLAHLPLGLFTVVSPYLRNPTAATWAEPLEVFHRKVQAAKAAFAQGASSLLEEHRSWAWSMLEITEAYVQQTQQKRSVTVADFEAYAARMRPFIRQSMDAAAKLQVDAGTTAMLRWKQMLGPTEWKKLYVIIPTIWPVAEHSPRWQIFRSIMDPAEVDLRLLVAEGVQTEEDARTLLGRIIADRLVGRLVLGIEDERGRRMTQCLSSQTDVLSDSARQALLDYAERSGCPMHRSGA